MIGISVEKLAKLAKEFAVLITLVVFAAIMYNVAMWARARDSKDRVARQNSVCPALLSITRSARDTLIVMKAEPLCDNYVLSNLK